MFKRIDYLGSGSLIVSIGGLLIGLSFKTNEQRSWGDVTVAVPLALFVVFLLLFLLVEARVSREPIMPMRLLTARSPVCTISPLTLQSPLKENRHLDRQLSLLSSRLQHFVQLPNVVRSCSTAKQRSSRISSHPKVSIASYA